MSEKACLIAGCDEQKIVARGLCGTHYDRWRRNDEQVVKTMGGPFIKVSTKAATTRLRKRVVRNAAAAVAKEKETIAPGSEVIRKLIGKLSDNGDLHKAVYLLVAAGFLSEKKLNAALELVRD